jgi:hypothetical protein
MGQVWCLYSICAVYVLLYVDREVLSSQCSVSLSNVICHEVSGEADGQQITMCSFIIQIP